MTRLLMLGASLRKDSVNKKLINVAFNLAKDLDVQVDLANFADFQTPIYDGDIEENEGIPEGAMKFAEHLKQNDGLVIASPEYNYSTPAPLKNLIDWVSRIRPMPWANVPILLISASPSLAGGSRGLLQTRIPLECCGALVHPRMFFLHEAYEAFTEEGDLKDEKLTKSLKKSLEIFHDFIKEKVR